MIPGLMTGTAGKIDSSTKTKFKFLALLFGSEKNRAPAWCDRVLWKGERILQLEYNSVMALQLSDHKPVYAVFSTGVPTLNLIFFSTLSHEHFSVICLK